MKLIKFIEARLKAIWTSLRGPLVRTSYWQLGADAARAGRPCNPPFPPRTFDTEHEWDLAETSWLNGWDWAAAQIIDRSSELSSASRSD